MAALWEIPNGGTVASWGGATGYNAGTATLPTVNRSEALPFVRLGTGTVSTTNGNWFNFGTRTLNLGTNGGFTFVGRVRFYGNNHGAWERIFDFGNNVANNDDGLFMNRYDTSANIMAEVNNGGTRHLLIQTNNAIVNGQWRIYSLRASGTSAQMWADGVLLETITISALINRTVTFSYIGRTHYSGDAYANIDINELRFYDRALSDAELGVLHSGVF
jgi:hypothetical protein